MGAVGKSNFIYSLVLQAAMQMFITYSNSGKPERLSYFLPSSITDTQSFPQSAINPEASAAPHFVCLHAHLAGAADWLAGSTCESNTGPNLSS